MFNFPYELRHISPLLIIDQTYLEKKILFRAVLIICADHAFLYGFHNYQLQPMNGEIHFLRKYIGN